jgi:hypothetical protein
MASLVVAPEASLAHLEDLVKRHLRGVHGVRVVGSGLEGEAGYVDITAHSVQAADFAADALQSIGGVSEAAWARGWIEREGALALRIFPTAPD